MELFDAAENASDSWIKSMIQGLQLAEDMRQAAIKKAEEEERLAEAVKRQRQGLQLPSGPPQEAELLPAGT